MKILLDECLPKKLKREFIGHKTFMVRDVKLLLGRKMVRCFAKLKSWDLKFS
jgi:hypothetical protein